MANHARSLIHDIDSNIAETYNSVIAKFVGGKRINYSLKNSYGARCAAAVTSFNTKMGQSTLREFMKKTGNKIIRNLEIHRKVKLLRNKIKKAKYRRFKKIAVVGSSSMFRDYGDTCQKPDMSKEIYEENKEAFLHNLRRSKEEIVELEKETRGQSSSGKWLEERRKLLTASNFAKVCKMRKSTKAGNFVKKLLYSAQLMNVPAINHGKRHEEDAILQLENQLEVDIKKCGLFVDEDFPYLGASPDGLIGDDTIIEIKCPFSSFNEHVEEAIKKKKLNFGNTMDRNMA